VFCRKQIRNGVDKEREKAAVDIAAMDACLGRDSMKSDNVTGVEAAFWRG
jgi:hypothetical protein